MWNQKDQKRERMGRLRGWIIYLLCKNRPNPLELVSLRRLLDRYNFPLTRRQLAEEVDYLRGLRLLRVFPVDAEAELDEIQQAKLIQRYADCESDDEMGLVLCARITTAGINFHDGLTDIDGIARVE
jgi:hypothetical protein